jgi:hypothetical protein
MPRMGLPTTAKIMHPFSLALYQIPQPIKRKISVIHFYNILIVFAHQEGQGIIFLFYHFIHP